MATEKLAKSPDSVKSIDEDSQLASQLMSELSFGGDDEIPATTFSSDSEDPPARYEISPSLRVDDNEMPPTVYPASVAGAISELSPEGPASVPAPDDSSSLEDGMASSEFGGDEEACLPTSIMAIPENEEVNEEVVTSTDKNAGSHISTPETVRSTPPSSPDDLSTLRSSLGSRTVGSRKSRKSRRSYALPSYAASTDYHLQPVTYGKGHASPPTGKTAVHNKKSCDASTDSSASTNKQRNVVPQNNRQCSRVSLCMALAFLVVALVGVGLWSYSAVKDLNGDVDGCETQVDALNADTITWENEAQRFQAKSEGLENEVQSLQSQLKTMVSRVADLEADKAALQSEKDDLLVTNAGLEDQVVSLEDRVQVFEETVQNLEEKNEEFAILNAQLNNTVNDLENVNGGLSQTGDSLRDSLANLTAEFNGLSAENDVLHGDLNSTRILLENEIERLGAAIDLLDAQNEELQNLTDALTAETEMLNLNTIPALNTMIASLEAQLAVTTENRDQLKEDLAGCEANVTQLLENVDELNDEIASFEELNANLTATKSGLENDLEACQSNLAQCNSVRTQCQVDLDDTTEQREACEADNNNFRFTVIPGLNGAIERLEEEVYRLETNTEQLEEEVDRLQGELGEFEILTNNLNDTVIELEDLSFTLNNTNNELEVQVADLEAHVVELEGVRDDLTVQNNEAEALIQDLNSTKNDLTSQIDGLEIVVRNLEAQKDALTETVQDLNDDVVNLQTVQANLESQVGNLEGEVQGLTNEVADLNVLLDELSDVSDYINNTAASLDQSFSQILNDLDDEITLNRRIALDSLRNLFRDASDFWDCAVSDLFGGSPWLANRNVPLGVDDLGLVYDEVEKRVLDTMCLNRLDYESFMVNAFGEPSGITFNNVLSGTSTYSREARGYYFPFDGEEGVTPEQWEAASYTCETIPPFRLAT